MICNGKTFFDKVVCMNDQIAIILVRNEHPKLNLWRCVFINVYSITQCSIHCLMCLKSPGIFSRQYNERWYFCVIADIFAFYLGTIPFSTTLHWVSRCIHNECWFPICDVRLYMHAFNGEVFRLGNAWFPPVDAKSIEGPIWFQRLLCIFTKFVSRNCINPYVVL